MSKGTAGKKYPHGKPYKVDGKTYPYEEKCASCGDTFMQTQLGELSDAIQGHKPVCSYKCNKNLGQVQ